MTDEERATAAITTKITPSEKTRFAALVHQHCINQSALVRTLIMEWVGRVESGQTQAVQILPARSALSRGGTFGSTTTTNSAQFSIGEPTVRTDPEDEESA